MTLGQFEAAAALLSREGIALRVFVLLGLPFLSAEESLAWASRSVAFAFARGATVVSIIPMRGGNGALEALGERGEFRSPRLADLEAALAAGLALGQGRVFADLWNLEEFRACAGLLRGPAAKARRHESGPEDRRARGLRRLRGSLVRRRLRRRRRRLGLRRLPLRAALPADRAIGRADREGNAPAICHRGVLLARRQPAAGGALPALRPAADRSADGVGNLAGAVSRDRLRPEARLHLLRAPRRGALLEGSRSPRSAARCREPAGRRRRHALVPRGLRPFPGARGGARRRRIRRSDEPRSCRRDAWRCPPRRQPPRPAGLDRRAVCASTRRVRAGFSTARSGFPKPNSRSLPQERRPLHALRGSASGGGDGRSAGRADPALRARRRRAASRFRRGAGSGCCASTTGRQRRCRRRAARSPASSRSPREAPAWGRLLARLPSVAEQFAGGARPPAVHSLPAAAVSQRRRFGGAMGPPPSAAAFVDPLLSTGFPLALLGIERLVGILDREWERPGFERALESYEAVTLADADAAALLVSALYATLRRLRALRGASRSSTSRRRASRRPRAASAARVWPGPSCPRPPDVRPRAA